MLEHTTIPLPHPQRTAAGPFTAVLRQGAHRLLAQAIEVEVAITVSPGCRPTRWPGTAGHRPEWVSPRAGRPNGHWRRPCEGARVRDRSGAGIRFHSALLPPYIRRSKSLEALLPWLYLRASRQEISLRLYRRSWDPMRRDCPRPR